MCRRLLRSPLNTFGVNFNMISATSYCFLYLGLTFVLFTSICFSPSSWSDLKVGNNWKFGINELDWVLTKNKHVFEMFLIVTKLNLSWTYINTLQSYLCLTLPMVTTSEPLLTCKMSWLRIYKKRQKLNRWPLNITWIQ